MSSTCTNSFKVEHAALIIVNIFTILTVVLYFTNVPLYFLFAIPAVTALASYCINQHRLYLHIMFMQTFLFSFVGLTMLGYLACVFNTVDDSSDIKTIMMPFNASMWTLLGSCIVLGVFCVIFAMALIQRYLAVVIGSPEAGQPQIGNRRNFAKASAPPVTDMSFTA